MSKIDQLIAVFKEVKEELSKNMNGAMNPGAHKPNATTGTSGGQGGMYRSEDGMSKNMVNSSPGGAQDMNMIKASENGQWHMGKADKKKPAKAHPFRTNQKPSKHEEASALSADAHPNDFELHPPKLDMQGVKRLTKAEELADSVVEKLEKACSMMKEDDNYIARDGKNREANPKLRDSDIGPGGKVHLIKEEGTNEEDGNHNKGKFKVMPMAPEKSVKHLSASGKPYNGDDKNVKKDEGMEKDSADPKLAPKDKKIKALQQQVDAGTYKPDSKKTAGAMLKEEKMGHIQGNESKGNDENKAPGRGTLSV
jgi:anti-sigma28 factor (negative regulator of flagellin synthesis)